MFEKRKKNNQPNRGQKQTNFGESTHLSESITSGPISYFRVVSGSHLKLHSCTRRDTISQQTPRVVGPSSPNKQGLVQFQAHQDLRSPEWAAAEFLLSKYIFAEWKQIRHQIEAVVVEQKRKAAIPSVIFVSCATEWQFDFKFFFVYVYPLCKKGLADGASGQTRTRTKTQVDTYPRTFHRERTGAILSKVYQTKPTQL